MRHPDGNRWEPHRQETAGGYAKYPQITYNMW